jgi:hypothetical protein
MTMNLDELRDAHAKRLGWEPFQTSVGPVVWHRGSFLSGEPYSQGNPGCHPVPATLDAIAGLMPPGYHITVGQYCTPPYHWWADARPHGMTEYRYEGSDTPLYPYVSSSESEILARARLAKLAWEAEEAK